MSAQITLTLPTDVFQQATALARRAGRPVEEVLQETIELSLRPLGKPLAEPTLDNCSDEEVLRDADRQMSSAEDERLSELLQRQQAGQLLEAERAELNGLMALYQQLLLRKACALREAVRRGLRQPLEP